MRPGDSVDEESAIRGRWRVRHGRAELSSGESWSAPVFMQLAKGSWRLQIGAEETDLVLLVMNLRGVDKLLQDNVSQGADMSIAAGSVGQSAVTATDAQMVAEMLSYSRSQGYSPESICQVACCDQTKTTTRAYGPQVSQRDIVEGTRDYGADRYTVQSCLCMFALDVRATSGQK
jgi:SH3 domain-containing YSC84-like protein 1